MGKHSAPPAGKFMALKTPPGVLVSGRANPHLDDERPLSDTLLISIVVLLL